MPPKCGQTHAVTLENDLHLRDPVPCQTPKPEGKSQPREAPTKRWAHLGVRNGQKGALEMVSTQPCTGRFLIGLIGISAARKLRSSRQAVTGAQPSGIPLWTPEVGPIPPLSWPSALSCCCPGGVGGPFPGPPNLHTPVPGPPGVR